MPFKKGFTPWNKGIKYSPERILKMSNLLREQWKNGRVAHKQTEETKHKISLLKKGEHSSPATEFKKGMKVSAETILKMKKRRGEKNPSWKGDEVKYCGLHAWISNNLGKPSYCDLCNSCEKQRYEWANIDKNYTRDFKSWIRLCVSCHRKIDHPSNKEIRYDVLSKKGNI